MLKKIVAIIGTRPQLIKHYPFELACRDMVNLVTIHTGQHFDENMSTIFIDQLGMSKPNYLLQSSGGSHGAQTGKMMEEIEEIFIEEKPDAVVVYGDTNSTLAGALVAAKLNIKIAHIEAGLRSYNRSMPEEINRVLTDHVSEWLFTPSDVSKANLAKEGISQNVFVIGDIMKDLILYTSNKKLIVRPKIDFPYYYATLHRPYNVDEKERLTYVLQTLNDLDHKTIFAIHPRTRNSFEKFDLKEAQFENIMFIEPQPYFENLGFLDNCEALITDSGGMQKEAYWLQKKCITVRSETEWVETLESGANVLIFENLGEIKSKLLKSKITFNPNLYGNGNTGVLILKQLIN
jgi:UDP-GlcNAc3NAcA epimerase